MQCCSQSHNPGVPIISSQRKEIFSLLLIGGILRQITGQVFQNFRADTDSNITGKNLIHGSSDFQRIILSTEDILHTGFDILEKHRGSNRIIIQAMLDSSFPININGCVYTGIYSCHIDRKILTVDFKCLDGTSDNLFLRIGFKTEKRFIEVNRSIVAEIQYHTVIITGINFVFQRNIQFIGIKCSGIKHIVILDSTFFSHIKSTITFGILNTIGQTQTAGTGNFTIKSEYTVIPAG